MESVVEIKDYITNNCPDTFNIWVLSKEAKEKVDVLVQDSMKKYLV